jgi:hypothetical protein
MRIDTFSSMQTTHKFGDSGNPSDGMFTSSTSSYLKKHQKNVTQFSVSANTIEKKSTISKNHYPTFISEISFERGVMFCSEFAIEAVVNVSCSECAIKEVVKYRSPLLS